MRELWQNETYRRIGLVGLAVLLALIIGVRTLVEYRATQLQSLRETYETKRLEYDKYARLLANRDKFLKLQAELGGVEKDIVGTRFLSAKTTALAEVRFQDLLDTLAKKNDLSIISRRVLKAVEIGELKELRVAINCRAELGVLTNFIYDLGIQDTAFFVDSFEIQRMGDKDERFYNFNAVIKAYSL